MSPQIICVQTSGLAAGIRLAIKALTELFRGCQRAKKKEERKKDEGDWFHFYTAS